MENPTPAPAAATETAPDAQAAPPASAAPASPAAATPPSAPAPWTRPPPDRVRTNIKVAGGIMVVMGILAAFQAYSVHGDVTHVYVDSEVKQFADNAGGALNVSVRGASVANPATVSVQNFNGTELNSVQTGDSGLAYVPASKVGIRVVVTWNNSTWTRNVLAPPQATTNVVIDPQTAPATQAGWQQPDASILLPWIYGVGVLGGVLVLTGIFAFMLRAPRLAFGGAVIFVVAAGLLVILAYMVAGPNLGALLQPVLLVAMGGFAVWAIRKGRDRFQPVRIGGLQL